MKGTRDDLGNRMKEQYENRTRYYLPRRTYTIVRIDGKCFHNYTKGLEKPYDKEFNRCMDLTAKDVLSNMDGSEFVYTQSDEISILLTDFGNLDTQAWFDGNLQKIVSISAGIASAYFNLHHDHGRVGVFDARAFTIQDPNEVANYFLWRTRDCIRNSISMLAQHHFSHKVLHGKSTTEMQDLLVLEKGVNWNNEPARFKTGSLQTRNESVEIPKDNLFDFYNKLIPRIPQ
jgi:tRNA(His) guanylyltransferase